MMYNDGLTWADMTLEYKNSLRQIKEVKNRRKGTGRYQDMVDCEIASSMQNHLAATTKEIKNRVLQEYKAITLEDIYNPAYGLTERQRQIAELRQTLSCKEIAILLNVEQSTIYLIYESAIKKILRRKENEKKEWHYTLSPQQKEILELMNKNLKNKEIAIALGISEGTVKIQKNRINKKRLTKTIKNDMR